jgi:hypothetical protein
MLHASACSPAPALWLFSCFTLQHCYKLTPPLLKLCSMLLLLLLLLLPQTCSQVLLTLDNLADRSQYINARNTFTELLAYGTIPVINENVSVGPLLLQRSGCAQLALLVY